MYCDVHDLCYTTSCPIGQAATGVAREAKRLWKLQRVNLKAEEQKEANIAILRS